MSREGIISANLTVILAVILLLNFAEREVGEVVQDWEAPWLRWSYYLILALFALSAASLTLAFSADLVRGQNIVGVLMRLASLTMFAEFIMLFLVLIRYTFARIYGVG